MAYMLVVSFSWGIAFIGPANFDTYDQCKYHAEKVETLRLRHSMGRPSITATCEQVEESK
tara:strand:+ start:3248 stop:3427 length:180 start_codon:yes stop_codon:yes gene_type:complete